MQGGRSENRHRTCLPFAAVNRAGQPGHAADLQRHHLLPRQAIGWPALRRLFAAVGRDRIGFDDFRRNGMLLPARESAVMRLGLPLHLGPHRSYNRMVIDRLGIIEASWARQRRTSEDAARSTALMRIALLQAALRRRILDRERPLRFNGADRLPRCRDFSVLDNLADTLWTETSE